MSDDQEVKHLREMLNQMQIMIAHKEAEIKFLIEKIGQMNGDDPPFGAEWLNKKMADNKNLCPDKTTGPGILRKR